jgi:hypothetical protein
MGAHPVEIAILAPVLDQTAPVAAIADRAPHVLERFGRHVRMAHHVVGLAHQLIHGETAHAQEGGVAVGDLAFVVRGGHQQFITGEVVLFFRDWQIGAHGPSHSGTGWHGGYYRHAFLHSPLGVWQRPAHQNGAR